jgi:hypothetical protein
MKKFGEMGIAKSNRLTGDKIKIDKILNREIIVHGFHIEDSKFTKNKSGKCLTIQIELENIKRVVFTGSDVLLEQIQAVAAEDFPFEATISKNQEYFEFT